MTATMKSRRQGRWRRLAWAAPAALFLLAPKCLLCVAGYVGLAAALGLNIEPALCGAPAHRNASRLLLLGVGTAATLSAAALLRGRRRLSQRRIRFIPRAR